MDETLVPSFLMTTGPPDSLPILAPIDCSVKLTMALRLATGAISFRLFLGRLRYPESVSAHFLLQESLLVFLWGVPASARSVESTGAYRRGEETVISDRWTLRETLNHDHVRVSTLISNSAGQFLTEQHYRTLKILHRSKFRRASWTNIILVVMSLNPDQIFTVTVLHPICPLPRTSAASLF